MKKLLALIAAIAFLPSCCVFSRASDPSLQRRAFIDRLEQETTALVHVVDDNGKEVSPGTEGGKMVPYCTGVWINADTMLSAEHCVDDIGRPPEVEVTSRLQKLLDELMGKVIPPATWTPVNQPVMYATIDEMGADEHHDARVVAVDMKDDIVLIKAIKPGKHPWAPLAAGDIHVGDPLHLVGQTAGMWWCYFHGYVAAHRHDFVDTRKNVVDMLQMSAPVFFGDSGGPAFNEDGAIVGIADQIRLSVPEAAWYVHRDAVRSFMKRERVEFHSH